MTFSGNNFSLNSEQSVASLSKKIDEMKEDIETNASNIATLDSELSTQSATHQADIETVSNLINENTTDISSLEESLEDYKDDMAEQITTETLLANVVESSTGRFANLEVTSIQSDEIDTINGTLTSLQEQITSNDTDIATNETNITLANNKISVLESKVDSVLEQGEIPISSEEVTLGDGLISRNGNVFSGKLDLAQSPNYTVTAGTYGLVDGGAVFYIKSSSTGYCFIQLHEDPTTDTVENVINTIYYPLREKAITNSDALDILSVYTLNLSNNTPLPADLSSTEDRAIGSGLTKSDMELYFSDETINDFTFYSVDEAFYIVTREGSVWEVLNGVLTNVTETKTEFSDEYVITKYFECEYKNYMYCKRINGDLLVHNAETIDGVNYWTYWTTSN